MSIREIKDKVALAFKYWYYTTLTAENIEKIIKRKEEELRNIEISEKQEIEKIKNEAYQELSDYHTPEEIDEILKTIIVDVN